MAQHMRCRAFGAALIATSKIDRAPADSEALVTARCFRKILLKAGDRPTSESTTKCKAL
jgi:hypothetical protein